MAASQNQVLTDSLGLKGTQQHPPNRYSFNKTAEYQQQLQEDLEKLLQADHEASSGSPRWVVEATKVVHHGGKSQLFNKKLLAASKIERHIESVGYGNDQSRRPSASSQRSRPPSSSTGQSSRPASHYKPNSSHQYLTDTMLYDEGHEDVECKLGRPTRTTLLRARQRCNSAPVNSYSFYKEEFQKATKRNDMRNSQMKTLSSGLRAKLGSASDGQSIHSFLTGARYNRAHYFDAKCVTDHGLYMPRSNPFGAFLMRPSSAITRDDEDSPPASPVSDESDSLLSVPNSRPNSATPSAKQFQTNYVNNQGILEEESTSKRVNRPKSSKFRHRPKSAAVSVDRKPYATNTISIHMKDQEVPVRKQKISMSVKSSFHPKVKPSPKYFQGVRVQGQSIPSDSSGYSVNEPFPRTKQQAAQRPSSGTVRKTGVTVKDLSRHLQKENILIGSKSSTRDTEGPSDRPNSPVNEMDVDIYQWDSETTSDDLVHRRLGQSDQRLCPSPVETPHDDSKDEKFQDNIPQDNPPTLKSSLQRVGSAKPKRGHVHFAEDVRSPRGHQNTQVDSNQAVFYVRDDRDDINGVTLTNGIDKNEDQNESQNNQSADNGLTEYSLYADAISSEDLHLELEPSDDMENQEYFSVGTGMQSEVYPLRDDSNSQAPINRRMLAPRETVKAAELLDVEQMELESSIETDS